MTSCRHFLELFKTRIVLKSFSVRIENILWFPQGDHFDCNELNHRSADCRCRFADNTKKLKSNLCLIVCELVIEWVRNREVLILRAVCGCLKFERFEGFKMPYFCWTFCFVVDFNSRNWVGSIFGGFLGWWPAPSLLSPGHADRAADAGIWMVRACQMDANFYLWLSYFAQFIRGLRVCGAVLAAAVDASGWYPHCVVHKCHSSGWIK